MGNLPPDFTFSQSSLQDYVDCARRFSLRYLQRQRWPAPQVDDVRELERRMEQGEYFHKLVHQYLIGIPPELLIKRIGDATVKGWFERVLETGFNDVPPVRYPERRLSVPLGDYALVAKFDLIALNPDTGQVVIIDWKTSRKLPRREWLAKRLQTIVYRYALAKGGDHLNQQQAIAPEQIQMRYWYADQNGEQLTFDYDAAQFKADDEYLSALVREIDTRADFNLTDDTRHCLFCVYRSLCDRGTSAGPLADWDAQDYDDAGLDEFDVSIDQIAEIAF